MCLNHPKPATTLVHGKIVFYETSPGCQNGWGLMSYPVPTRAFFQATTDDF